MGRVLIVLGLIGYWAGVALVIGPKAQATHLTTVIDVDAQESWPQVAASLEAAGLLGTTGPFLHDVQGRTPRRGPVAIEGKPTAAQLAGDLSR